MADLVWRFLNLMRFLSWFVCAFKLLPESRTVYDLDGGSFFITLCRVVLSSAEQPAYHTRMQLDIRLWVVAQQKVEGTTAASPSVCSSSILRKCRGSCPAKILRLAPPGIWRWRPSPPFLHRDIGGLVLLWVLCIASLVSWNVGQWELIW